MRAAAVSIALCLWLMLVPCLAKVSDDDDRREVRHNRFQRLDEYYRNLADLNERWANADAVTPASKDDEYDREDQFDDEDTPGMVIDVLDEYDDDTDDKEKEETVDKQDKDLKEEEFVERYVSSDWTLYEPSQEEQSQEEDDRLQDDGVSDWEPSQSDAPSTSSPVEWKYYGTRNDLRNSRTQTRINQTESKKAREHALFVSQHGSCKTPKEKLIDIQVYYPDASKRYIPHCTILHRCGDDVGCCITDSLTCQPKSIEKVDLYFYVTGMIKSVVVEKLTFINHTECECVPKKMDYMVEDEDLSASTYRTRPVHHHHRSIIISEPHTEAPVPLKKCQCPTEFSVHMLNNNKCECDCFNKQRVCMRIKKGKEYFGLKDRICIQSGQCQTPSCEFGDYITRLGRCPRKYEKQDEIFKHSRVLKSV